MPISWNDYSKRKTRPRRWAIEYRHRTQCQFPFGNHWATYKTFRTKRSAEWFRDKLRCRPEAVFYDLDIVPHS